MLENKVLSLDQSLTTTGYSVGFLKDNKLEISEIGKICTSKKKDGEEIVRRGIIADSISNIIKKNNIKIVLMEDIYGSKNVKTLITLARLSGRIEECLIALGCEVLYMKTSSVRSKLINGKCSKEDIANFIIDNFKENKKIRELGVFNDRQCKGKNSDIYDSIANLISYFK